MADLKLFARISKQALERILKHNTTRTEYAKVEDKSACLNCSINNLKFLDDVKKLEREEFCKNKCTFVSTKLETLYHAIDHEVGLNSFEIICNDKLNFVLSKSCLKQYIFYHFIPANRYFVRKKVSFSYIAKSCGISIPTARENHKKLVQAGLVYSTKNSNLMDIVIDGEYGLYDFEENKAKGGTSNSDTIVDYLENDSQIVSNDNNLNSEESLNETKKKKKYAYATLALDQLKQLFKITNVNDLKVEIKRLLWADASTGMKEASNLNISLNKDNLIEPLPEYIKKSNKRVSEILNSKKSNYKLKGNKLDTSNFKRPPQIRESIRRNLFTHIANLFEKHNQPYSSNFANKQDQLNSIIEKTEHLNLPSLHPAAEEIYNDLKLESAIIINDFICLASQFGIKKTFNAIKTMFKEHSYINDITNTIHTDIVVPGAYIRSKLIATINKGVAI